MLELYSELPLQYLAQRKHEIEDFKVNMFPEIEKALDDMGCSGSVDFTSSKSSPVGYDTIVIKAKKPGAVPMDAIVTVKFPSAHPKNLYTIQWKDANGVTNQDTALVGKAMDVPGVVEVYFKEAFGESSESKKSEESDDPDVADAKECKAALDKYVLGLESMKDRGLETILTEDVSVGAEMPRARVELGVRKDGKLDPYFTFDFSGGMCGINFHLVKEEWDEVLSDHPSVDAMIEDLVPDIRDEIESQ